MMAGAGFIFGSLSSCVALPVYKTIISESKISVPISLFAQTDLQIVRTKNAEYDIALRKEKDATYSAILMRCTHADNQLTSTGNGFTCNLHGSKFDSEGAVTKGPAELSLKKYPTQVISDNIVITIN